MLSLTLRRSGQDFIVVGLPTGWEDLLGVPLRDLEGMLLSVWLERFVHPDDLAPSQKAAAGLLKDASVVVGFVNRYKTPNRVGRDAVARVHARGRASRHSEAPARTEPAWYKPRTGPGCLSSERRVNQERGSHAGQERR